MQPTLFFGLLPLFVSVQAAAVATSSNAKRPFQLVAKFKTKQVSTMAASIEQYNGNVLSAFGTGFDDNSDLVFFPKTQYQSLHVNWTLADATSLLASQHNITAYTLQTTDHVVWHNFTSVVPYVSHLSDYNHINSIRVTGADLAPKNSWSELYFTVDKGGLHPAAVDAGTGVYNGVLGDWVLCLWAQDRPQLFLRDLAWRTVDRPNCADIWLMPKQIQTR